MRSRDQAGFKLVELMVVIVMLGIIAAVAVPRFRGYQTEGRVASVKSLGGTLKSAANMAHDVCMAQGCVNESTIVIQGERIVFTNGYPDAASIGKLARSVEGFTAGAGSGNRFTRNGSRTVNCWVQYNAATIMDGVVQPPTISYAAGTIIDATTEANVNDALRTQC
jgi:MSHA pilin protein MshA